MVGVWCLFDHSAFCASLPICVDLMGIIGVIPFTLPLRLLRAQDNWSDPVHPEREVRAVEGRQAPSIGPFDCFALRAQGERGSTEAEGDRRRRTGINRGGRGSTGANGDRRGRTVGFIVFYFSLLVVWGCLLVLCTGGCCLHFFALGSMVGRLLSGCLVVLCVLCLRGGLT